MTIRAQSPIDESTEPDELLSLLSRADPHWLNKWARSPDRYLCRDCRRDVQAIGEYCMLKEQIWYRTGLGSIGGVLCLRCIEHRLGRLLRRRDFEIATTREQLRDFGNGPMVPKVNIAPPSDARWYRLVGVELGNSTDGDEIAVVEDACRPTSSRGLAGETSSAIDITAS